MCSRAILDDFHKLRKKMYAINTKCHQGSHVTDVSIPDQCLTNYQTIGAMI